jgi:hypothetical protein
VTGTIVARTILFDGELWVSVADMARQTPVPVHTPGELERMAMTLTNHVRRRGGYMSHADARRTLRADRRSMYPDVRSRAEDLCLIWSKPSDRGIRAVTDSDHADR